MSFPAYPKYKEAGFVGLDKAPKHWQIFRFKQLFQEINQRSESGEEELLSVSEYYGVKPRAEKIEEGEHLSRAETLEGYKICQPGDLVMNIMLAWKRGLGISRYHGIVSPAYAVFRLVRQANGQYYHYLLRSEEYIGYFKTFSSGVIDSRLRLYPEVFGRLTALYPPKEEQIQIARFLDYETARIDALIEEQQRLIALLKEKRQAVISHAVTKGLDPNVPMKDSGVEWLGEVPEHWAVAKLKWQSRVKSGEGISPNSIEAQKSESEPFPVIGGNGIMGYTSQPNLYSSAIAIGRVGALCGNIHRITNLVWVSDNALALDFNPRAFDMDFLYYSLTARNLNEIADRSAQPLITGSKVTNQYLPRPELKEQFEIATFVDSELKSFDELMAEGERGIQLLKERRSALISAAVTGKIDVRNWQPDQPSATHAGEGYAMVAEQAAEYQ